MSESFNFEYCRCRTCGYEWRKGLNGSHSCAENLKRQLAEAREENEKLTNKNTLLAEGNSILMQQLKEKNNE